MNFITIENYFIYIKILFNIKTAVEDIYSVAQALSKYFLPASNPFVL